jgi:hypothetical protein
MNSAKQTTSLTCDNLLNLLSDDDVVSVSSAETSDLLTEGDLYLDLEHLDKGVCRAKGMTTPTARLLPKKALQAKTWNKIMAHVAPPRAAADQSSP